MAEIIFNTINRDRKYLRVWLPFVDFTIHVSDTENFLKSIIGNEKSGNLVYCIWYNEEFAGLIGYKDTDWVNHKTEFGYWLAENMQGKGIITSVLKVLIPYTFKKQKINRIQIKVALGNTRSASIAERLGFKKEGVEREGEYHNRKYLDLQVYSLLKHDWFK